MSSIPAVIRHELLDIVEWPDPGPSDIAWRFLRPKNEIKYGAQLIVRPGQAAVFVDQGRIADVFAPGRYRLETRNLPVLATLKGWKYGFASPFKAEVVFLRTAQLPMRRWGTKTPLLVRDPQLGAVRLRAYGTFVLRVTDPRAAVESLVGAEPSLSLEQVDERIRDLITARMGDLLGDGKHAAVDVAGRTDALADEAIERLASDMAVLGLAFAQLTIENVSLPDDVLAAIDRQAAVHVAGGVGAYSALQAADALRAAAEGSAAAQIAGVGAGILLGQQFIGGPPALGGASPAAPMAQGAARADVPAYPMANAIDAGASMHAGRSWWYVAPAPGGSAAPLGPWSTAHLVTAIASGEVERSRLVWTAGMGAWESADRQPEFAAAITPPPLPA